MSGYFNGLGGAGSSAASNMGLFGGDDPLVDSMRESNIALDILLLQEELSPLERTVRADSAYPSSSVAATGTGSLLFAPERALRASPLYSGIELFDRRARAYYGEAEGEAVAAPGYEDELDLLHPVAEEAAVGSSALAGATRVDSFVFAPDNTLFDPYRGDISSGKKISHPSTAIPHVEEEECSSSSEESEEEVTQHRHPNPWKKEDLEFIKQALASGQTVREIHNNFPARTLDAVKSQASILRKKFSLPYQEVRWSEKDSELIKRELLAGKLPLQIQKSHFKERTPGAMRAKVNEIRKKYKIPIPTHSWTTAESELIERKLIEGKTNLEIYRDHFSDVVSLKSMSAKADSIRKKLKLSPKRRKWTEEEHALIVRELKNGKSPLDIHKEHFSMAVSLPSLRRQVESLQKKHGLAVKKSHRWTEDELKLLKESRDSGMSVSDIHREHFSFLSITSVRERAKKLKKAPPSRLGKRASAGSLMESKKARLEE